MQYWIRNSIQVALSLILALLLFKPAPLYILDEVTFSIQPFFRISVQLLNFDQAILAMFSLPYALNICCFRLTLPLTFPTLKTLGRCWKTTSRYIFLLPLWPLLFLYSSFRPALAVHCGQPQGWHVQQCQCLIQVSNCTKSILPTVSSSNLDVQHQSLPFPCFQGLSLWTGCRPWAGRHKTRTRRESETSINTSISWILHLSNFKLVQLN